MKNAVLSPGAPFGMAFWNGFRYVRRAMKKPALPFLLLAAAILAFFIVNVPLIVEGLAERALMAFCYDGTSSVGKVTFRLPPKLVLRDVFMKSSFYELRTEEIEVDFGKISVVRPRILLVDVPREGLIQPRDAAVRRGMAFHTLEVLEMDLDVRLMGVTAQAKGSFDVDLITGNLRMVHLAVPSLQKNGARLEDLTLDMPYGGDGYVFVSRMAFGKAQLRALKGPFHWVGGTIAVRPFVAEFLGGALAGGIELHVGTQPRYTLHANITSLDLPVAVHDFELEKKLRATGELGGRITLTGGAGGIESLEGELTSVSPGGDIVIEDRSLLEDLAARAKQPIEIVEASFKEYHFDTGQVRLGLEDGALGLRIEMNGAKGTRKLDVYLHDFFKNGV